MMELGGTMVLHDTQDHASQVENSVHQCKGGSFCHYLKLSLFMVVTESAT